MNKGLVGSLIGLTRSILEDISEYHPHLQKGFKRDLLRLESLSSNHREKVFTLFLPALGKIFDQSLESGVLVFSGEPLSRPINRRTTIPRLFQGMWRLFFDDSGCLKHDISPDDIRSMRTLMYAFKKYRLECSPTATMKVVEEYYDVDQALPPPSQEWDGSGDNLSAMRSRSVLDRLTYLGGLFRQESLDGEDAWLLSVTQRLGDRISSLLGEFNPLQSRFRHGPGAVSDLKSGRGFKYSFPEWGPRLQHVFPASEFAFANLSEAVNTDDYEASGLPLREGASRLYAVPKTQKGPRLIASEPTCNQWCQQSVRSFLNDAIRSSIIGESIDFGRQDLSGDLALAASVDKSLATVDLSSASDRLSCWLVERLFRANSSVLSAFIACRTRYIVNDIDKKSPKLYKLRKFASMGSALTFPVQSLSFYILCVSAGLVATGTKEKDWELIARQVRVYGDDLIVPVLWMPVLEKLFTLLYLKINRSKTFVKGNFRESCGTDAYNGVNVSPGQVLEVFDESNIGTLQGVVDCSNNLFLKGFRNASNYLLSPIPANIRKLIPWVSSESDSFGLKTGSGFHTTARKRWNADLHRWEYMALRFRAKRSSTKRHESFANLLQYFTEDPTLTELALWESGVFAKPVAVVGRGWSALPLE
jgi:hypothetical protein